VTEDRVRRAAWIVLACGVLALLVRGADAPADPTFVTMRRQPLPGFGEVAFEVTTADGRHLDWCALLAATQQARERGLMGQDDLRGYDAMVFRFAADSSDAFYMFRTRIPLSIAWFDAAGGYVSASDMEPCASDDPGTCPVYPAAKPYRTAIETDRGGLGRLGLAPGSTLAVGGKCT
jgi:uncharacterized membrane protein (UPF0127 family)